MSRVEDEIDEYLASVAAVVRQVDAKAVRDVVDLFDGAYRERGTIFLFGNGGGAATSAHLACDLGKGTAAAGRRRIKALSLSTNVPLITAWANDTAYENIFAEQLDALVRPDDVVIGISGSGNSENVLRAIRLANKRAAITVGMTGFDGGQLKNLVTLSVHVPHFNMEQIEDAHLILEHMTCTILRAKMRVDTIRRAEE